MRTGLVLKSSHRGADKLAGETAPIVCPGYQGRFQYQLLVGERAHGQTVPRNAPCANLREESDRPVAMDQKGGLFRGRDMMDLSWPDSKVVGASRDLIVESWMYLSRKKHPDLLMIIVE